MIEKSGLAFQGGMMGNGVGRGQLLESARLLTPVHTMVEALMMNTVLQVMLEMM